MKLFSRNYDKPGPGVSKDEPRKKGIARFFELLFRDFWDLIKFNFLFCLIILPSLIVFLFGFVFFFLFATYEIMFIASFAISLVLAFPIGGVMTAFVYYVTKMMRDEPTYVWFEFKRKFKENYKQAAPVGIISTAFIYSQIMLWTSLLAFGDPGSNMLLFFIATISLILFAMIMPYVFLHLAYIDLPTFTMVRNSMLMSFGFFPRSIMGVIFGGIIWVVLLLFFPNSMMALPLIVLIGVSLSLLLNMTWVWKPFNEHFKIEETLLARQEEEGE